MTETLSPPACRCGNPATQFFDDAVGNTSVARCDQCAHKEGLLLDNTDLVKLPPAPKSTLDLAIERGLDADAIAKIVGLIQQREADDARKAFARAMVEAQSEMPVIVRDGRNDQTKSGYATLETVNKNAKPVYSRHGFALSFSEGESKLEGWKRTACVVRHVGGHEETHFVDLPVDGIGPKGNPIGGMNSVQGAISTGSYGQRVLLCRIFNITVANTDIDGQTLNDVLLISPEQRAAILEVIEQDSKLTEEALLKWLGAPSIKEITRKQFERFQTTYLQKKAVKP